MVGHPVDEFGFGVSGVLEDPVELLDVGRGAENGAELFERVDLHSGGDGVVAEGAAAPDLTFDDEELAVRRGPVGLIEAFDPAK